MNPILKTHNKRFSIILMAALFLSLALPHIAAAQDPTPSADDVNAIAKQLYCPVCENIPLDACSTQACVQWRGIIRDKLAEGWSEKEIKQYFVDQYGDRVLAEPPREGLNWLVYIVPPVAFLAGAYLLFKSFRTWRTAASDEVIVEKRNISTMTKSEIDAYVLQLEEELRNR